MKKMRNSNIETFQRWLSRGFLNDESFSTSRMMAAKFYFELVLQGITKGFSKIFPDISKSALSRIKRRLTEDGILCNIFRTRGDPTAFLIPLHPYLLIRWIAANVTYTDVSVLKDRFGAIIDNLQTAWQENFGVILQEESYFAVMGGRKGWPSYVMYGNLLGWMLSSKSQLQKVIFLTPHLGPLRDPCSRQTIMELSKDIDFEFFALLSSVDDEMKTILEGSPIKIWTFDSNDKNSYLNLDTARSCVMIDKQGMPYIVFEGQEIPETQSYVGVVHINCEHELPRVLESLKTVAKQYVL